MYKTFFWGEICLKILFTVWILQMIADPRLREDDEEGFRHVRVGEHPLEGCTRILAGACPEQGRMGEDDKGRDF